MRQDMRHLLVDRGSTRTYEPKNRIKQKVEDDPEYQGVKYLPHWQDRNPSKYFNDYLAPLRRYLKKQVGRYWDEVYSEIRAVVKPNSTTNIHVYQHLDREVEKHVKYIDGEPYSLDNGYPIRSLYVCPDSGILKAAPRWQRIPKSEPITRITLDSDRWYEQIDEQWYLMSAHRRQEALTKEEVEKIDKKQLSKKELKELRDRINKANKRV